MEQAIQEISGQRASALALARKVVAEFDSCDYVVAPSGSFGIAVDIPLNNPFLPAAARNQFCAFDVDSGAGYTPRFTAAGFAVTPAGYALTVGGEL